MTHFLSHYSCARFLWIEWLWQLLTFIRVTSPRFLRQQERLLEIEIQGQHQNGFWGRGERWNEWVCSAALSRRRFPDSDVPQEYFRRQFWSKNDDLKTDVKMWQKKPETTIPIHFCGCRQIIIKWSQLGGHFLVRNDLKLEFKILSWLDRWI